MLVSQKAKIEGICSKASGRIYLNSPYLDLQEPGKPQLVATDGHAMVVLDVGKHEHDVEGWVAIDALKAMRKSGPRAEIVCNGACATPQGTFPRPDVGGGSYPDWRQVMVKEDREGEHSVTFDAGLLKKIVDACGGEGPVRIHFIDEPKEPIRVEVHGAPVTHRAVLMPIAKG